MQSLKDAFLKCSRMQFPREEFPQGVPLSQLRDMIRTFSMGWSESIIAMKQIGVGTKKVLIDDLAQHYLRINSPDYLPDISWEWWH